MKKDSYFEFSSILFTTSKKNTILTIISTVEYICVYFLKFFLGSFWERPAFLISIKNNM